jgi:UvrD-like helicase C-terminal domain
VGKGEGSIPFEEEKRLCYVAMTRAKSELLMTWRQTVPMFSPEGFKTVERPRSRFLDVLVAKKPEASSNSTVENETPKQKHWREKYRSAQDKASQIKNWSSSSKMRNFGTLPAAKFTGTASVYASNTNKMIDMKVEILSTTTTSLKRPSAPIEARSTLTSKDQKFSPSVQSQRTTDGSIRAAASTNNGDLSPNKSKAQTSPQQSIDSSWFFPIGSKVRHKLFGDGVVLTPLTTSSIGSMSVRVEFKNGEKQEFPVQTTELSPIVTK